MSGQEYSDPDGVILDADGGEIVLVVCVCHGCGAVVCDLRAHDAFHAALTAQRRRWGRR